VEVVVRTTGPGDGERHLLTCDADEPRSRPSFRQVSLTLRARLLRARDARAGGDRAPSGPGELALATASRRRLGHEGALAAARLQLARTRSARPSGRRRCAGDALGSRSTGTSSWQRVGCRHGQRVWNGSRRRRRGRRDVTAQQDPLAGVLDLGVRDRDGRQQRPGVRVQRLVVQPVRGRDLDDGARGT
jgi:hypothetical protein